MKLFQNGYKKENQVSNLNNPQTGMVGIDSRLRTLLEDNGIELVIYINADISNF
jgi:hypothetical protein